MEHPFYTYTGAVLAHVLGEEHPPPVAPVPPNAAFDPVLRAASRPGVTAVVLLGLGGGELARELAGLAGPGLFVAVAELDVALARRLTGAGKCPWITPDGPAQLLCDASPLALAFLARLVLPDSARALVLPNPELPPEARRAYDPLRRLLAAPELAAPDSDASARPHFGAIVSPDEPDLAGFCAGLGALAPALDRIALVWDGQRPPDIPLPWPTGTRHLARPLGGDFAAQRNAMLDALPPGKILYLDADERCSPEMARALPVLAADDNLDGVYFPRLTLDRDEERVLAGYGLWPDPQLRLFANRPGVRFARPVHERVLGLTGRLALATAAPIMHLSHVQKSPEELTAKLSRFDAAAGRAGAHVLSRDYPSLPRDFFATLSKVLPPTTLWPLPGTG